MNHNTRYKEYFIFNNKKEGEYKDYYNNKQMYIISNYIDGKLDGKIKGEFKSYNSNIITVLTKKIIRNRLFIIINISYVSRNKITLSSIFFACRRSIVTPLSKFILVIWDGSSRYCIKLSFCIFNIKNIS